MPREGPSTAVPCAQRRTVVATFDAAARGTYTVTAGDDQPQVSLAVGDSVADPMVVPLVGSPAITGLWMVTAGVLVFLGPRGTLGSTVTGRVAENGMSNPGAHRDRPSPPDR